MLETAINIIVGAFVAIATTLTVEMQRRPKLRMHIAPAETATYGAGFPASSSKYLHVDLVNEQLPRLFRWMSRGAALQCHGTITFHYLDNGARYFAKEMPVRFSRSPEPIPLQIRGAGFSAVLVDPDRISPDSRIDLYPGERTPFDIAVKFDSEAECYGWSNLNYLCNPPWRHPDWKVPAGRYLVEATITSSGAKCSAIFRLLNPGNDNDFRLEEALPSNKVNHPV